MELLTRAAATARLSTITASGKTLPGLTFTSTDDVCGAVLPLSDQSWIALRPFTDRDEVPDPSDHSVVVRNRMRLLHAIVRLSTTRCYDWHRAFADADANGFSWLGALRRLESTTPLDCPHAIFSLRWTGPRFLLLSGYPVTDQFPEQLQRTLASLSQENRDDWDDAEFQELFDNDEKIRRNVYGKGKPLTRHYVVELGISIQSGRIMSPVMHRIIDVLEEFEHAQRALHAHAVARNAAVSVEYRVTALRFSSVWEVVSAAVAQLGERVRGLQYLQGLRLSLKEPVDTRSFQQFLSSFRHSGTLEVPDSTAFERQRRLYLSVENKASSFATTASVARTGSVLGEIDTVVKADDLPALAAWLAFGLFHVDATSSVTSVCVRTPTDNPREPPHALCSPEWVEIFKRSLLQVAASTDLAPIAVGKNTKRSATATQDDASIGDEELPTDRQVVVTVRAKTHFVGQPNRRTPILAVVGGSLEDDLNEQTRFQVLRKRQGWVAVAVPGAGAGWIPATAIMSKDTVASDLPVGDQPVPQVNGRIKSFTWSGSVVPMASALLEPHANAIVDLIRVIGAPLVVLQLSHLVLENCHIEPILRACPNLVELNLAKNFITDIEPIVTAVASGSCAITSLNVDAFNDPSELVIEQCAALLQLPTCKLRQLIVRLGCVDGTSAAMLRDALRAHANRQQLEYVCIEYDRYDHHDEPTNERVREFFADVVAADCRCHRPLPLRSKFAFLSVVQHESRDEVAINRLDTSVLGTIFAMAATSHKRVIDVRHL